MATKKNLRLDELAAVLQLSTTTVSRALSGNGRVSAATRAAVLALAEERGYRSPSQRRIERLRQASGKSGNVAVVVSRDLLYESEFFHSCLLGAAGTLAEHHYETLLILCNTDEYTPLKVAVEKGKLDGVIFTRAIAQEKSLSYLKKKKIPTIVVGSGVKDAIMVDANTVSACRELAGCLVNAGCKRLAFIGGNMNYTVNTRRLKGLQIGLSDHRLELDTSLIFLDVEDRNACRTVIEMAIRRRADGIVCGDDVVTIWAYDFLTRNGIAVPRDMLLAACYDSNDLANHTPSITAIRIDARAEGSVAGETMIQLLNGEEVRHTIRVDHDIRLRESTRRPEHV